MLQHHAPAPPLSGSKDSRIWLHKVMRMVNRGIFDATLSVSWLAQQCYLSERHFCRKVKGITGQSPSNLIIEAKLQAANQLLQERPKIKVKEVAELLNFSDVKYFSRRFKKRFNSYPSELT